MRPATCRALVTIVLGGTALATELPPCRERRPDQSVREALGASNAEHALLARLVYAEATSTGFPDDALVHGTIAWGVMNRVRLGLASRQAARRYGATLAEVVFKPHQFNPAVSTRSRFSRDFLCPKDAGRFTLAAAAAAEAIAGDGNPFLSTAWEKESGLSLVVSFYYPASEQARGPLAPWESDASLSFVGDVATKDGVLPAARIRFYRLAAPPRDVEVPAAR